MTKRIEFGDSDHEDAYAAGDTEVDDATFEDLVELEHQMALIATVRDPDARLQLAKRWARALNGECEF